jgi:hypothetical protein
LFVVGDNARHHAYGLGILYLVSLPFILIGLISLDKRKYWLVFFWLLLAPVASSLAVDAPNASRSLIFLPTWQIFEAIGIVSLITVQKKKLKLGLICIILVAYLINFTYYLHNYMSHTNNEYGQYWQHGYKEAMIAAQKYESEGRKVVFSSQYEQPYIFYLFYSKFEPASYLEAGGSKRISKNCFSIGSVFFGQCEHVIKKGDIYISQNSYEGGKLKKINDVYDAENKIVGTVYESL